MLNQAHTSDVFSECESPAFRKYAGCTCLVKCSCKQASVFTRARMHSATYLYDRLYPAHTAARVQERPGKIC